MFLQKNRTFAAELKLRTCFTAGSLFVSLRETEKLVCVWQLRWILISQHQWRPTRAKGLTLFSAPMASSSCCGDRPHSKFLTAQTESVTAATLVTDCSGKREDKRKRLKASTDRVFTCCDWTDLRVQQCFRLAVVAAEELL